MSCPDVDRWLDYWENGAAGRDEALEDHLRRCKQCRDEYALIGRLIDSVRRPVMEVSEELNEKVFDRILRAQRAEVESEGARVPVPQVIAAGVLGFLTSLVAVLASGATGAGDPALPLGISLLMGSAAAITRARSWTKDSLGTGYSV